MNRCLFIDCVLPSICITLVGKALLINWEDLINNHGLIRDGSVQYTFAVFN